MQTLQSANMVLRDYWDGELPVDPVRIAEAMGVRVKREFEMGELSGSMTIINGEAEIRYVMTESELRQRFTVAHELGHYCLKHGTSFRDTSKNFSSNHYDIREVKANRFAAELLMPERFVRTYFRRGMYGIDDLAREFKVSEMAMKYRLQNLGIL